MPTGFSSFFAGQDWLPAVFCCQIKIVDHIKDQARDMIIQVNCFVEKRDFYAVYTLAVNFYSVPVTEHGF